MADGIVTEGALLEVSEDGVAYTPVVERAQLRVPKTTDIIDMTSFDEDGFRARRGGLRVIDVEASGNYVPSDAGLGIVEDSWLDAIPIYVRTSWVTSLPGDPVTRRGWIIANCVVTDLGEGGNVGDKVELSLKFAGGGRPTLYTA